MNTFTRVFLLASGLLLAAVPSHAEDRSAIKKTIERMVSELNLTEAQKSAAQPIIAEGLNERVSILKSAGFRKGKKPTFRQLLRVRGPINASREKTEARLSAVLTTRQMSKYKSIVAEMRETFRTRFN